MKLAIIIPAYNEENAIAEVLNSLPRKFSGVREVVTVVIDDGSTDKTFEIASKSANFVVKHVINLGVGAALSTGFEAAIRIKADVAVTLDADGQHNPKNIQALIDPIIKNRVDLVVGSRMFNTQGMPFLKIVGNWIMNLITFFIFGKWSSDTQSGMRAFSKKALENFDLHSLGYEICSEIIGEAKRNRLKYKEVPIETIYTSYSKSKGQSAINAVNILTKLITIKIMGKKR